MLDIKFLRSNPEIVKQNIKNKFQDSKLPLVDEVIELDKRNREIKGEVEALRAEKNKISKMIGTLMKEGKREEAEEVKKQVTANAETVDRLSAEEKEVEEKIKKIMMTIPNIIDPSVPIGKDDSENVEVQRYGEPVVPDFEIPYHAEIMEKFNGLDLDSARKVAGNGFYYLMGDIARLHSAVISYARDFMINRGFTYCVPPFMIRSDVVTGVMSFAEMDAMMYKIEGEDLYLIGTSEHSMIGKFIDTIIPEEELPKTLTSYSPCFRKEKGAHGLEERGVYRIHQFEKQEMIVVCKPEESKMWFDKLWQNTVDLFRSMDIPVRTLECCSGDLADLKVKSVDVEAWSPRQKKYFEVGIHFNGGIFSVQVLHHTPVPLEIQNIVSLMDAPHVSKKTNGTLQSIGHAMIGQRTVRIRFIIAELIDAPHINSFLGSRSQNGTHIGSIVQWKYIPDIAIKLHHTVLVGEIYPLVIIGCYLPSLGPLAINTFIKIDDKAIPAGNCFDQREKKKKAEKKVE